MTRGTDVTDMKRTYRTAVAGDFPDELELRLRKSSDLRYGENPNQPGAIYVPSSLEKKISLGEFTNIRLARTGKGGLSATNYMDITRAVEVLKFFKRPASVVMKHGIPSGFAVEFDEEGLESDYVSAEVYRAARDTDSRSAFGSVVVFNSGVNAETANAIVSTYVEVVAAPSFDHEAIEILDKKKDIRVVLVENINKLPRFAGDDTSGLYDIKALPAGRVLVQKPYLTSIKGAEDLITDPLVKRKDGSSVVVSRDPTERELNDMLTAWYVNLSGVRSNGVVFVKDDCTLVVGTGQQERVGAVEHAITKTIQKAIDRQGKKYDMFDSPAQMISKRGYSPLEGAVVSSDGFFPFRDSIDLLARAGVSAIIQPGGSKKDDEVIEAVNEYNMAMAFTLERCFLH